MIQTITILALYLAQGRAAEVDTSASPPPSPGLSSCLAGVNSVYVETFLSNSFADQITGNYVLTTLTHNGFPVFLQTRQPTSTYLYVDDDGFLGLSMCTCPIPIIQLMPVDADGTCFGPNSAWTSSSVGGVAGSRIGGATITAGSEENDDIDPVVLKEPVLPPDWCEPCKQVLDGPMAGNYLLAGWNDTRCEDGCLYWNSEGRHFCFEAGSYQVLLECPAYQTPANSTNEPTTAQ